MSSVLTYLAQRGRNGFIDTSKIIQKQNFLSSNENVFMK